MVQKSFYHLVAFLLLGFLVGCAPRGVAEFQLYSQAFDAQYEQGESILDTLARAERTVVLRKIQERSAMPAFNPDEAAYFVEDVDPPLTASLRASLQTVKLYNATLHGLINGEAAQALSNRVGAISTNLAKAYAAAQAAAGGALAVEIALVPAIEQALPIFTQLATHASRAAFRKRFLEAYPAVKNILLTLRNNTPAAFELLLLSRSEPGSTDRSRNPETGLTKEDETALEKDRKALAAWVLLLDTTLTQMDATVLALKEGATPADLAGMEEAAIELRILTEKIRDSLKRP